MRRSKPELLVAILIALVLGWYVWYTRSVIVDLSAEGQRSSAMFARIFRAFGDTTPGGDAAALLDLSASIRQQGVPLILTKLDGTPIDHFNLPFDPDNSIPNTDAR